MIHKSVLIIAALAASAAVAEDVVEERWRCYGYSDYNRTKVLITLSVYEQTPAAKEAGLVFQPAEIEVAGTEFLAAFTRPGFDRRWDFLDAQENEYAFVIDPEGTGRYYVFEKGEDATRAADVYKCEQQRR